MSEKRSAEKLAGYRVDRGKGGFKAIPMTEREVEDRNFFIRLKLRGKPMNKLSSKQIEQVRVYRMGDLWIFEDENLMCFALGKEEKNLAPVQEGERLLPENLAADGYSYCGSFAESTGDKILPEIAMTGELTLRGKVLAIGGLKEKLLAAKAAGIKKVFVPAENKRDIAELEEEVLSGLELRFAKKVEDIWNEAVVA